MNESSKVKEEIFLLSSNDSIEINKEKQQGNERTIRTINRDPTLFSKFGINMTKSSLDTLTPPNKLDDNVINFYIEILAERSKNDKKLPKVHCMNTLFWIKYRDRDKYTYKTGKDGISAETKDINIFDKDIVLYPIHTGPSDDGHWSLAIVNMNEKTIKFYDSLKNTKAKSANVLEVLDNLLVYLEEESKHKIQNSKFSASDWIKDDDVRNMPKQDNDYDCGVFCCMYAEYITRNERHFGFGPEDMNKFRKQIRLEIIEEGENNNT